MVSSGDFFLLQCKSNYFKGITPSNSIYEETDEYKVLIEVGIKYFKENGLEEFAFFLRESQYFVALWTAHIILKYGEPAVSLAVECINTIKEYSEHPVNLKISLEEKKWLERNLSK
ncbi:hypothetical protein [Pedobacter sp. MW01-1-1]|uniref:hypothetical protein n=1 Tax=Pedobacter sp. MW01-1-1 TaxID=3383027 RepID=UPI003FEF02F5